MVNEARLTLGLLCCFAQKRHRGIRGCGCGSEKKPGETCFVEKTCSAAPSVANSYPNCLANTSRLLRNIERDVLPMLQSIIPPIFQFRCRLRNKLCVEDQAVIADSFFISSVGFVRCSNTSKAVTALKGPVKGSGASKPRTK